MTRKQRTPPKVPAIKARALETRRLVRVRGGDGLGITVSVPESTPSIMSQQHNEALVRL